MSHKFLNTNSVVFTLEEVQEILRIKQTALYARIARGSIEARRLGGRTVIYREELQRYLNVAPVVDYVGLKPARKTGE